MTPHTYRRRNPSLTPVLRWTFHSVAGEVTCALEATGNRAFDVAVIPHWDVSSSVVDHFDRLGPALLRHAELAKRMRDGGWVLTDHTGQHALPTAA